MKNNVKERILLYLKNKGIAITRARTGLGWSKNSLPKSNNLTTDRDGEIVHHYSDVNSTSLLTGQGFMTYQVEEASLPDKVVDSFRLVPLVNAEARERDMAIMQSGRSMMPTVPSGSILLIRKTDGWMGNFRFGNIFLLVLMDRHRTTKRIRRYDENTKDSVPYSHTTLTCCRKGCRRATLPRCGK